MIEKVKVKWHFSKKKERKEKNSVIKTSQEIYFGTLGRKILIFEQA